MKERLHTTAGLPLWRGEVQGSGCRKANQQQFRLDPQHQAAVINILFGNNIHLPFRAERLTRLLFIIIGIWTVFSCRTTQMNGVATFRDRIPIVSFCDLPNYIGKLVYLRSYYSGVDEYWSLNNVKHKTCNPKLRVDLQFAGQNRFSLPAKFEDVFKEAYESYHNTYLLIEAIGVFENDSPMGYGHLGSNNSRFVVSELINASLLKK